jgi:hypothetical protein
MKQLYFIIALCLLFGLSESLAAQVRDSGFELQDPAQDVADSIEEAEKNYEKAKLKAAQQQGTYSGFKLARTEYLALLAGNYVHGFKEFDTTVKTDEESVSVGIYYDPNVQEKNRAEQLAERFRKDLPLMFEETRHEWAANVGVLVTVHSYDQSKGY